MGAEGHLQGREQHFFLFPRNPCGKDLGASEILGNDSRKHSERERRNGRQGREHESYG